MTLLKGPRVTFSPFGFPQQIKTPTDSILAENIHFHFYNAVDGKEIRLKSGMMMFANGDSMWRVSSVSEKLEMEVQGNLVSDGIMNFEVTVKGVQDVDMKDIVMHIPYNKGVAKSMLGLGKDGAYQPDSMYHWKWNPGDTAQKKVWIGNGKSGLVFWVFPNAAWLNGGIDVGIKGRSMLVNIYTGPRRLHAGDVLHFNFKLYTI